MAAETFVLPDAGELSRRLEVENQGGALAMFLPLASTLAGRAFTSQGFVMELTLAAATYAGGDQDATRTGFMAMPIVIDALIDDEDARAAVTAYLRATLAQ